LKDDEFKKSMRPSKLGHPDSTWLTGKLISGNHFKP
jgi:hypothetical protein